MCLSIYSFSKGCMGLTYLDAAALAFGRRAFSTAEFRNRIGAERAAKLLHEMKARGLVERVGRARYRLLAPEDRPDVRAVEWEKARRIILDAPLRMAWTGPTAVEAWTRGRYRVGSTPFRREFHVAIPKEEETAWRAYLDEKGLPTNRRRGLGAMVVLDVVEDLVVETVRGEPVIPRADVVKAIRGHPELYAEAEDLID